MKHAVKHTTNSVLLRQKAEELLNKRPAKSIVQLSEAEAMKLIHELEVHQIELEIQQEELLQAKVHAENAFTKFSELYDFAPSGYFSLTREGEIIELNHCVAKMLGKERPHLIKSKFGFFVSDDTKSVFNLFLDQVFSSKAIETCEVTLSKKDDLPKHVHLSGIADKTGDQCFVTAIDITEQKLAEESLKISLAKYQFLFNSFPLGITLSDKDGNIIESNKKAEQLLGLSEEEQIKRQIDGFEWTIIQTNGEPFPPEEYASVRALKENRLVENIEMGIVKSENDITWLNVTAAPVPIENYGVAVAYNDITERKQAEAALNISEERFHSLFNNMSEGAALHELVFEDGKPVNYCIIDVNNPFLKISGVSREQVVGKLATEAYGTTTPPYFEEYTEVGLSKNPISFETYFAPLDKHISISVAPWHGHGFATIFSDISDRKRAEEEINLKNEELQKLNAEKDKFFSIIAHDLRSPFSSFLGFTEMMVEELSEHEQTDLQKMAEMMQKSASNLYSLLNNLLEWSQIQQGSISFNPAPIQLRSIVDESLSLVFETAKTKGIEMVCDIHENIVVFADSHFLQTIIRNLVSNALKFTPKGGKVSLSAKSEDDQNIKISVSDTGIGMSKVMINNLFRPDVKTNRLGTNDEPSTGLGLLLCKEFIEKHDGEFWVESTEGKGSVFYFTLPYYAEHEEDNISKNEITTNLEENQMRKIKLLIAEDDEASGMLLERITENYCEKILKAKTGVEAVEICRNNPDLDLVLMDIGMPDMDGFEATRQIRQFNPGVIIIAQTAFVMADDSVKTIETGCTDFIAKPIQRKQLMKIINMYF